MNGIKQYYIADKSKIGFLRFIIEAYDNLALMTTLDAQKGLVVLNIAPGCQDTATALMEALGRDFYVEYLGTDIKIENGAAGGAKCQNDSTT